MQKAEMTMRATDKDILLLIPQRPPFVMVDRLLEVEEASATSEFEVRSENILVEKGLLQETGVIENIAQTAAAMNGYHALSADSEVKNGYLGGIKDLEILSLPEVGETITTLVEELHNVMGASIVRAESRVGERVLARCEMKVFMD
jgi:predicted hotdog family 3-hydroxylacyl-ACP dehydratase